MRYRTFGRTGWQVSEIGYGMWGMGGWTGSDDQESLQALDRAFVARLQFLRHRVGLRRRAGARRCSARRCARTAARPLYVATKIPPKNMKWPGKAEYPVARRVPAGAHPRVHREEPREPRTSDAIDLQQFHVWSDAWATDDGWQRAVDDSEAREAGAVRRHQRQSLGSLERARGAEDRADRQRPGGLQHLRPGAGRRAAALLPGARHRGDRARAVRRRQPDRNADGRFASGRTATGETSTSTRSTCRHARARRRLASARARRDVDLPELALRFILEHPAVSTTIPGMRAAGARGAQPGGERRGERLPPRLATRCRHRWDRWAWRSRAEARSRA